MVFATFAISERAIADSPVETQTSKEVLPSSAAARTFINRYCIDCHSGSEAEQGVALDALSETQTDDESAPDIWSEKAWLHQMEAVYQRVHRRIMPPPDHDQPDEHERREFLSWLDGQLNQHLPIGGSTLRRLSRREYLNTIRSVFELPQFELPIGFPPDNEWEGFDNHARVLSVAPSHLEAYEKTATLIADQFFPPPSKTPERRNYSIRPDEMVISYSSACLIDGAMRLASSGTNPVRHATWPNRFEAPASGMYSIEVSAEFIANKAQTPRTGQLRVGVMSSPRNGIKGIKTVQVIAGERKRLRFDLKLEKGQTVGLQYTDGPLNYDDKKAYEKFLVETFKNTPRLAAAWKAIGNPARGGNGWNRVKAELQRSDLDSAMFDNPDEIKKLARSLSKNSVSSGETLVYKFFEEGPAIAIHGISIDGPTHVTPDREQVRIADQRTRLIGSYLRDPTPDSLTKFFAELVPKLARRDVTPETIERYVALVEQHRADGGSLDESLHLALRSALLSPMFLFRTIRAPDQGEVQLDPFELATRLSYFLTSGPPDEKLRRAAATGEILDGTVLRTHAERLIGRTFAQDFGRQWLGLSSLDSLMPDKRLIRKFTGQHRNSMREEVTRTLLHVLDSDLPISDLIAPDFVFTDALIGWEIYGLERFRPAGKNSKQPSDRRIKKGMQQVSVPRDGRVGGLLCMPAVMMATANGVDTQPVLRGVWVLDTVLGTPPPEPPDAVPALTPDTSGAISPRERLAAHMSDESCAVCHREIDPLGFVLENFDPIGRWRDEYPSSDRDSATVSPSDRSQQQAENRDQKTKDGATWVADSDAQQSRAREKGIDASGVLVDGTIIEDVTDLKRHLAQHPEWIAQAIGQKWMTYATGRSLNHREKQMIRAIIAEQMGAGQTGTRSLLLALIDSPLFRAY